MPSDTELNNVIDWFAGIARAGGNLATRVDRLTRAFVDPVGSGSTPETAQSLECLLVGVRYIVFNIPMHLAQEEERLFVAVLRPLDRPDDYSWTTDDKPLLAENCTVHVLGGDLPSNSDTGMADRLKAEWGHVWNEYADLTYALQRDGVLTWNQYLLHGCENPKPFGLSWKTEGPDAPSCEYYLHATTSILETLGISLPDPSDTGAWNRAVSQLPLQMEEWVEAPSAITKWWHDLTPRVGAVDVGSTVTASILHLLRSYARWGGGAFMSIPVVIASNADRHASAVLSVCSDAPLSAQELVRWRLVAGSVLPLVASSELVTHFALEHEARDVARRQAEAWAHEVKNRTAPIITFLSRAAASDHPAAVDAAHALHGTLSLNAASYGIQLALGGGVDLARLQKKHAPALIEAVLQYLLNYRAASSEDDLRWTPRWTEGECIEKLCQILQPAARGDFGERARNVLIQPEVVWTTALLRELVQNIRVNNAPANVGRRIDINYTITIDEAANDLVLLLEQRQRELTVNWDPEDARGLQLANELFGRAHGIGLGEIEVLGPKIDDAAMSGSVGAWNGVAVVIRSRARLALEATDGQSDESTTPGTEHQ